MAVTSVSSFLTHFITTLTLLTRLFGDSVIDDSKSISFAVAVGIPLLPTILVEKFNIIN